MFVLVRKSGIYTEWFYAGLLCVVLFGFLLGSILYGYMDRGMIQDLSNTQSGYVLIRQEMDFSQILFRTLSSSSLFLLVLFISGVCAVGHPFIFGTLVLRGLGLGVVMSQMYSRFGIKGMIYGTVLVLPNGLVCTLVLVLGAREAICLSNQYASFTLTDRQMCGLKETIRIYCAKFLVLEAVLAVSAGADCVISWITKGLVPV